MLKQRMINRIHVFFRYSIQSVEDKTLIIKHSTEAMALSPSRAVIGHDSHDKASW